MSTEIEREPIEAYHADFGHVSHSMLKTFRKKPSEYRDRYVTRRIQQQPDTDAQRLGQATHSATLEPERRDLIRLIPQDVLPKNGARSGGAWKEWAAEQGDACLVKQEEYDRIRRQIDAVWANPEAAELLGMCKLREHSSRWQYATRFLELNIEPCKCRFDAVFPGDFDGSGYFIDLKTSAEPTEWFYSHAKRFGYDTQAAWYRAGFRAEFDADPLAYIIAAEAVKDETEPEVVVWQFSPEDMDEAERRNESTLRRLQECRTSGQWHSEWWGKINQLELSR